MQTAFVGTAVVYGGDGDGGLAGSIEHNSGRFAKRRGCSAAVTVRVGDGDVGGAGGGQAVHIGSGQDDGDASDMSAIKFRLIQHQALKAAVVRRTVVNVTCRDDGLFVGLYFHGHILTNGGRGRITVVRYRYRFSVGAAIGVCYHHGVGPGDTDSAFGVCAVVVPEVADSARCGEFGISGSAVGEVAGDGGCRQRIFRDGRLGAVGAAVGIGGAEGMG